MIWEYGYVFGRVVKAMSFDIIMIHTWIIVYVTSMIIACLLPNHSHWEKNKILNILF